MLREECPDDTKLRFGQRQRRTRATPSHERLTSGRCARRPALEVAPVTHEAQRGLPRACNRGERNVGLATASRKHDDATAVGGFPSIEGEDLVGPQCRRWTKRVRPRCIDCTVDEGASSRPECGDDLAVASSRGTQDVDAVVPDGAGQDDALGWGSFDDECPAVVDDPNGAAGRGFEFGGHAPETVHSRPEYQRNALDFVSSAPP